MSKGRTGDPWMEPADYGKSLKGFGLNLLVSDLAAAITFHRQVLAATELYSDEDVAIFQSGEIQWMLHADHTYEAHPMHKTLKPNVIRGVGAELRVHGRDPDAAERAARGLNCDVLSPARDQPGHGLREVHLVDPDGYVWVPDVPLAEST